MCTFHPTSVILYNTMHIYFGISKGVYKCTLGISHCVLPFFAIRLVPSLRWSMSMERAWFGGLHFAPQRLACSWNTGQSTR